MTSRRSRGGGVRPETGGPSVDRRSGRRKGGQPETPARAGAREVQPAVVISNGFGRFHLRVAAVEAARRGALAAFITGGYPTPELTRWSHACGLSRVPAISRFLLRAVPVPDEHVRALWAGEPFSQLGARMRSRVRWPPSLAAGLADHIHLVSRRLYSTSAARVVGRLAPERRPGGLPLSRGIRWALGGDRAPARLALPLRPYDRSPGGAPVHRRPRRAPAAHRGVGGRSTGTGGPSPRTSTAPITCSRTPTS